MHPDPIVEEVHRIRQELLTEFGGDVDALMDEANRRLLNGEFDSYGIVVREPKPVRTVGRAAAE
ncbi:MAG: hypothetical protein JO306_04000 [Gemmatimonadetes bacterium]|nr:hypothetical protein [Gemmatimonadota bacterium]